MAQQETKNDRQSSELEELRRIVSSFNPFGWALEEAQSSVPYTYYWLDRYGTSPAGETALHRLVALHATRGDDVTTFLKDAELHRSMRDEIRGKSNANDENTAEMLSPHPKRVCRDTMKPFHILDPLQSTTASGINALHVAVFRNSYHVESVVKALLKEYPEMAAMPMSCGSFPLHLYMEHSLTIDGAVLQHLLAAYPQAAATPNARGETPLSLLWRNVLRFRWARDWETAQQVPDSMVGDKSWMTVMAPDQFLDFGLRLIRASVGRQEKDGPLSWHDICQAPCCPPLLIRMLLYQQEQQQQQQQEQMSVVSSSSSSSSSLDKSNVQLGSLLERDQGRRLPLHCAAGAIPCPTTDIVLHVRSVVELVLDAARDAALQRDAHGRFPLHYVVCRNHGPRAVRAVLQQHPDALEVPDPVTELCPALQYARCAAVHDMDLQFELIRSFPSCTKVA